MTHVFEIGSCIQCSFFSSLCGHLNRNSVYGAQTRRKTLSNSYRCNPEICTFVSEKLGINISSHGGSQIKVIETTADADTMYRDQTIVKLFYRSHQTYGCYSKNWGESKGEDHYHDVCVVLNDNTWNLSKNGNLLIRPKTKSKLYVAITRTKGNLYLLPEKLLKSYKKFRYDP